MFLLKCNKLTLGYNNKDILHSFDYGIHSGEYLCARNPGRSSCAITSGETKSATCRKSR